MKTYQNPQPHAVEKANKPQYKPSNLDGSKHKDSKENLTQKPSLKEIFKEQAEEKAWRDSLSS